jgi:hypothetical protein
MCFSPPQALDSAHAQDEGIGIMGSVRPPAQVKLFCALLVAPAISLHEVETVLAQTYGPIVLRTAPLPFTQTTYYEREMGLHLTRLYVAFEPLISIAALATVKHTTNQLEAMWSTAQGQRRVNVDPGYLDLAKVVLASTKDHSHRLYIGNGIFAEVTLRYRQHTFQPWDWTYPDYRVPATLAFFQQLRERYKAQLRRSFPSPSEG